MLTKNNWLSTNLGDRFIQRDADLVVTINPYPFKKMSFGEAVEQTVFELKEKYSNFYLGLSGGYDSDFVLHTFKKYNVDVIPVIACCGNEIENEYAFKTCKKFNIDPVYIKITEEEFLDYYENSVYKYFNGVGYNSTQLLFLTEYVKKNNGVLLTGEHLIGDGSIDIDSNFFVFVNEWDFYHTYLFPEVKCIDFFLYSLELSYSMLPFETSCKTWAEYKHYLYNIEYREKMKPVYSDRVMQNIKRINFNRKQPAQNVGVSWTKKQIQDIFNPFIIK